MTSTAKNLCFLLFSTLVGAALMWWVYRGFDFARLASFFTLRSNYLWIVPALVMGIMANLLRSLRWRMLLTSAGIRVSVRRSVELVFVSYLVNAVTPRLGELTRSLLVRRGDAEVSTRALGTVVVEKLADVGCLVVLIGLAVSLRWERTLSMMESTADHLTLAIPVDALVIAVGCAVCIAIGLSFPLRKTIRRFASNLWQGVSAIGRLKSPLSFAALCVGIWTCNFLQLYLLVPCFEEMAGIGLADMIHVFAAASIGALLPTPAAAGPWHFATVRTLTGVYAVAKPVAQSFAFIVHALKTLLVMLLGVLGYLSYYSSVWAWWRRHH